MSIVIYFLINHCPLIEIKMPRNFDSWFVVTTLVKFCIIWSWDTEVWRQQSLTRLIGIDINTDILSLKTTFE